MILVATSGHSVPWGDGIGVTIAGFIALWTGVRIRRNKRTIPWTKPSSPNRFDAGMFPVAAALLSAGLALLTKQGTLTNNLFLKIICWPILVFCGAVFVASVGTLLYLLVRPTPKFLVPPEWRDKEV